MSWHYFAALACLTAIALGVSAYLATAQTARLIDWLRGWLCRKHQATRLEVVTDAQLEAIRAHQRSMAAVYPGVLSEEAADSAVNYVGRLLAEVDRLRLLDMEQRAELDRLNERLLSR